MRKVTWKDRLFILADLLFWCLVGTGLAVAGIYYGAAYHG